MFVLNVLKYKYTEILCDIIFDFIYVVLYTIKMLYSKLKSSELFWLEKLRFLCLFILMIFYLI